MSTYIQRVYQQCKNVSRYTFPLYEIKYRHHKRMPRYISIYNKGLLILGPWEVVESSCILCGDFENVVCSLSPDFGDDLCDFSYQFGRVFFLGARS